MIPFHPLAEIFPLIDGPEFDALVADVSARGLVDKIVLLDGQILDGRNRYRAAIAAGLIDRDDDPWWRGADGSRTMVKLPFAKFVPEIDGDPLAYVVSKNLARRHLNEAQRASVAAKIANLRHGERADRPANLPVSPVTQGEAAERLSISERALRQAQAVHRDGTAELRRALDHGRIAVSLAEKAARLAPELQREVARRAEAGEANVVRGVVKRAARAEREALLAVRQRALPDRRYGVILADPEWAFDAWSPETGMDRAPDNHYPTSPTAEIAARDVAAIAADDCALFLWATAPKLPDALAVLSAWGFVYRTHLVWHKLRAGAASGPGYWFTGEHELLLLGIRGHVPAPAPGTQWRSLVAAAVRGHSVKPDVIYELIEGYFPTLPKIELNARRARPGWDRWGLEAPDDDLDGEMPAEIVDQETGEIVES